jgi:hypothetical protein
VSSWGWYRKVRWSSVIRHIGDTRIINKCLAEGDIEYWKIRRSSVYHCFYYNYSNPATLYGRACTKPGKWVIMYLCVKGIDFAPFYDCSILFWICFDCSIVHCFLFIIFYYYYYFINAHGIIFARRIFQNKILIQL